MGEEKPKSFNNKTCLIIKIRIPHFAMLQLIHVYVISCRTTKRLFCLLLKDFDFFLPLIQADFHVGDRFWAR